MMESAKLHDVSAKIFVSNLSWATTDERLRAAFSPFGLIIDVILVLDRETGRPRGFGFITYASEAEAAIAIEQMNEQELDGRNVRVCPVSARQSGGGGGGGGGGTYGSSGYSGWNTSSYQEGGYGLNVDGGRPDAVTATALTGTIRGNKPMRPR